MALEGRYCTLLEKCTGSLSTWKNVILEHVDEEKQEEELAKLKAIAEEYCKTDYRHRNALRAISSTENTINEDPSQCHNVDEIFDSNLKSRPIDDYTSHDLWQDLFTNDVSVREVKGKKSKTVQYEAVDESIMCSNTFSVPIDPITKMQVREPIRNNKCGHVYDQSIYDYIRQSKSKARCPYMGCKNNNLKPSDLTPDPNLKRQIDVYLQNHANDQSSEDESD